MMAKLAEAPLLLQGDQTAAGLFDKTSFSPIARLVVRLTAVTPPKPEFGDALGSVDIEVHRYG